MAASGLGNELPNGASVMSRQGLTRGRNSVNGAAVTVNLTAVANAQTLGFTLLQVNYGSSTADVFILVGILLGDTTGTGTFTASDIGLVKAHAGNGRCPRLLETAS